ncbi:histidine phosphatase family protein [Bacillus sp. DJP31]|uniref:histidine phosphatase family protein n=1 Tax=Bacillus sp. DJP31 TaxID=3409789 RepID=UPI003BB7C1A0
MSILYIVRHCQATGQEMEAVLTDEGVKQANELAEFLSEYPIKRIISSPYVRAIESIKPYADKRGILIESDERLGERVLSQPNVSNWLELLHTSFEDFSLTLEGGESSAEATSRVESLIKELVGIKEEHVVLVSHGNLTTLLLKMFDEKYGFDEWKAMTNPDVYEILLEPQSKVRRIWRG